MTHELEREFGLSAEELLDALAKRFRARVTLEGAVAETQLAKVVSELCANGAIDRYVENDEDGKPDFNIWLPGCSEALRIECKNVRNSKAYKVETQKTRASKNDPSSRFYGVEQFEILAVCMGKKTHDWREFRFVRTSELKRHPSYTSKLAVFHPVPISESDTVPPWYCSLGDLLKTEFNA